MFCENCGSEILENDKFCESCGFQLEETYSEKTRKNLHKNKKIKIIYLVLLLLIIGEYLIYSSNNELRQEIEYARMDNNDIRNKIKKERERQAQQTSNYGNGSVYITSWGYDFSGDGRLWGRNSVKLSNGREFYTWLEKQTYGMKCYELFVQGGLSGNGSNCSNNINNNWAVSCGGSGQFWVQGNQSDVVKAIVSRCGN